MCRLFYLSRRHFVMDVALTVLVLCTASAAYAQADESDNSAREIPVGRLDFDAADLPEANVEVDLSQEMFRDLFGIGDAAVAGVAESLLKSQSKGDAAKATEMAAHQLEAARQILQLAGDVVHEVHVRVYEDLPAEVDGARSLYKPFEEQLKAGDWETLARVRKNDEVVRVAAIRNEGALQGVFVVASDGDSLVLANVVCDVSPENVRKLTSAATKIGLENGLAEEIQRKFRPRIVISGSEVAGPATLNPPSPPTVPAKQ